MAGLDSESRPISTEYSAGLLSRTALPLSPPKEDDSRSLSDGSGSSYPSESSTVIYEQEPFDQFSPRAKELCHLLWDKPKQSPIDRFLRSGPGEMLRAKKFLNSRGSSPSIDVIVDRLVGGGYNRIIGLKISDKKSAGIRQFILRVPRMFDARLERDVAALRFVRQHASIPVPEIEAVDLTEDNPLKKPYVIQKRIPGSDLAAVIQDLSQKQLCTLAKELGRILIVLQSVISPTAGIIEETSGYHGGRERFSVRPFDLKAPFGIKQEPEGTSQKIHSRERLSTLDFFVGQLGRWKVVDAPQEHKKYLWDRLITAARQMDQAGFFEDDENCLCHLDFQARNIMVNINQEGDLSISGVLDWDSAIFAPRFISCAPPRWIWADEDNDDDDDDESNASAIPESETGKELKRCFEEAVGPKFLRYAYEPQYRLGRILFRVAIHGLRSNEYFKLMEKFMNEWTPLYESIVAKEDRIPQSHTELERRSDALQEDSSK